MEFLPSFHLSLAGGWWFSAFFLIGIALIAVSFPAFRKKVLVKPDQKGLVENVATAVGFVMFQGGNLLALFMPLKVMPVWFPLGLGIFALFFSAYLWAVLTFVRSDLGMPVTAGPYRFSRNPQQMALALMWAGAGLCMGTWLYALLGLLQFILAYPGFMAQERFCIARYGTAYKEYMTRVPRYLFVGK